MRTAARAVKSASGEKDQTKSRGKIISKMVRIGRPMEKGLRRFSVPDLLVACCLLKPLTASEQYPNKTGLYHIYELLNSLEQMTGHFLMILQIVRCEESPKTRPPILRFYFLVGVIPCLVNSRSARSLTPACSPMASLRIRPWQGSQILPLKFTSIFPQIIHFFFSSLMATILFRWSALPSS